MQQPKTVFVKVKYFFMFFELFILFLKLETIVNIKKMANNITYCYKYLTEIQYIVICFWSNIFYEWLIDY